MANNGGDTVEHPRKPMRLSGYDYATAGAYYITVCIESRRPCLCYITVEGSELLPPNGHFVSNMTEAGNEVERVLLSIPEKYPTVSVDKYVIMPNHLHMILMLGSTEGESVDRLAGGGTPPLQTAGSEEHGKHPTVGAVMGWFKYQTTKQINEISGTQRAKIWQRSYYDRIIRDDGEYLQIWRYIDENPLRWREDELYIP